MTQNPFETTRKESKRRADDFALGFARVLEVPDDSAHQVVLKPLTRTTEATETDPQSATVSVVQKGDVALPQEGDVVVYGRITSEKIVVLDVVYSRYSDIRDYDHRERHIGAESGEGVFLHGPFGVVPKVTEDATDAADGAVWYRTDIDEFRGKQDGTVVEFGTSVPEEYQ